MSAVRTATLQEVGWKCPNDSRTHTTAATSQHDNAAPTTTLSQLSRNALLSIQLASMAAREFDATYALRNIERELSVPLFAGHEIVLESTQPIRLSGGHFHEFGLHSLKIVMDLIIDQHNEAESGGAADSTSVQQRRLRLADRVCENSQFYSVKYLQKQLIDCDEGPEAACEMIVEAKILMNLSHPSHPNLLQVFGANGDGIDSFLESGRKSFFLIVDRLEETLDQRLDRWRLEEEDEHENEDNVESSSDVTTSSNARLLQRLEVANDICSALVFLASRELVYYLRPDKVGFDVRCGRVKLCDFGQARQEGTTTHSPSILRSTQSSAVLAYTAPEVLCQSPATVSSDVYAFGILLWELWTLQRPFHAYSKSDHWIRVIQNHERPPLPPPTPGGGGSPRQQLVELMQQCWDPHFRPTIKKVQDDLETALLFNDLPSEAMPVPAGAENLDPSSTRAVSSERGNKPSVAEPSRGRLRGGPNIIEQHMRRTAVDPSQSNSSPEVPSSGGSVATYSTYRTRGDYSAFTHGPSSPTRNLIQQQRRRRSVSRGPPKPRATSSDPAPPNLERGDSTPIGRTHSGEGSGLAAGATRKASGENTGPPSRPRRLSMEIAPKPSTRSKSIQRSRSMNIDGSGKAAKILTDALSQLEHLASSDAPSTETPLTAPSSESTADHPIMTSPVQRRRSSRRHPTIFPDHNASKNSPTGTAATSGSSSTESSPTARTPPSTQSGTGIRAAQHRQGGVRRAESLRRLVQGDVFPDLTSPHRSDSASPVPMPKSQCHSAPQRKRGVQRSQSLIMKPPSSDASSVLQPDKPFSLDNIPQTPSPTGRVTQNRRLSSGFQQQQMPSRSVSGFDQLAIMQQGLQSVHENSDDNLRTKACEVAHEADSQSPVAPASSPRRRMMSRASSARDMPRRHHSYSHPQKDGEIPHDRRSLRAERTMVASAESGATRESFSARLRAEMAAEATASAAAAAAAQDAIAPRVARAKVRARRNSYHDA